MNHTCITSYNILHFTSYTREIYYIIQVITYNYASSSR